MSSSYCDDIAGLRRKIQRVNKKQVIFLDQTHLRISEAPNRTLVLPGQDSYVVVDDTSAYAARYDMIACCNSESVFPPMIFTPNDR